MKEINNALITNYYLDKYEGSQLLTLDIAGYFKDHGAEVTVIGFVLGEPMTSLFRERGIEIINPAKEPSKIFKKKYDLVWGHHWPLLGFALFEMEISFKYLVQGSLSPFVPIETIWMLQQESEIIYFNSFENLEIQKASAGNSTECSKYCILINSLPMEWFKNIPDGPKNITKIAVISNHVPAEVIKSIALLKKTGVDVDLIGAEHSSKLVTPNLIDKYDAVVTIGHTVQKALSRNRMVYCYDRFGGPGWITQDNIKTSLEYNFSGRCCNRRLSPEAIFKEIIKGCDVITGSQWQQETAGSFSLDKNMSAVLDKLKASKPYKCLSKEKYCSERKICQSYINSNSKINITPFANLNQVQTQVHCFKMVENFSSDNPRIKHFKLDFEEHERLNYKGNYDFLDIGGALLIADKHVNITALFLRFDEQNFLAKLGIYSPGVGKMFPNEAYSYSSRFSFSIPLKAKMLNKKIALLAKLSNLEIIKLAYLRIS